MRIRVFVFVVAAMMAAVSASAATISGIVSDASGAALPGARVVIREVATGREQILQTSTDGGFTAETSRLGTFLVVVTRAGFSEAARTIVIAQADQKVDLPLQLSVGTQRAEVTVTAARAEREIRQIPLHVETVSGDAVAQANPLSTGDALAGAANITQVGGGPFGVRPRLRGLDSTRLLVLVDGERLNTARQATERTGAEVGLVPADVISRIEIVNGAGTLLYGSDALAGTINIITNEPGFSATRRVTYGLNSFYSSNEQGRRGTLSLGMTSSKLAVRVQGGAERFGNYHAGSFTTEDTRPFFASGDLRRADTIDDGFGFAFKAFPDPFNAPFVRTDDEVPNSSAKGNFVNASVLAALGEGRTLRVRYQGRRMTDIGFPDFAQPYFFNATSLPFSNLDRFSARFEAQAIKPWLAKVSLTAYDQRTERLLRNLLPVQFPVPSATFLPINVMRLDILSDTEQRVWTPGFEAQAILVPASNHLLTTGFTVTRDRSSDERTTTTTTSLVGQVVNGQRGPEASVLPSPVVLGPASVSHPVRVPDATLRDVAMFVQDEWRIQPRVSIVAGLRGDFYNVTTDATPGYGVASVVAGATPAIDPSTLPDPNGATYARRALTGDIGLVANAEGRVTPFIRFGRSYRHPNLEEMLFAGPATVGNLAPNVTVKPEIGDNFDAGAKVRAGRASLGAFVFLNRYQNFIAQDLVVAKTSTGPIAQATNYADVQIGGLELNADAPIAVRGGVLTLSGGGAFTRGTITKGTNPLDGSALDGSAADNITPTKVVVAARFTDARGRWFVEYGGRTQAKVSRVARTLLESPFIIAQDLLSLDGFTVHRIGAGISLPHQRDRMSLTFAIENLANTFYREQFQFAPARGRSFTVGLNLGVF